MGKAAQRSVRGILRIKTVIRPDDKDGARGPIDVKDVAARVGFYLRSSLPLTGNLTNRCAGRVRCI